MRAFSLVGQSIYAMAHTPVWALCTSHVGRHSFARESIIHVVSLAVAIRSWIAGVLLGNGVVWCVCVAASRAEVGMVYKEKKQ